MYTRCGYKSKRGAGAAGSGVHFTCESTYQDNVPASTTYGVSVQVTGTFTSVAAKTCSMLTSNCHPWGLSRQVPVTLCRFYAPASTAYGNWRSTSGR